MARKPAASVGKSVRNTSTPPDTVVPSRMEWARSQKLGQCLTQQAEPRVPSRQQWKQRALLRRYTCVVQNKVSTNFGGTHEAEPNESVGAARTGRTSQLSAAEAHETRFNAHRTNSKPAASHANFCKHPLRPDQAKSSARRDRAVSLTASSPT